eukprot:TRINITY_DN3753_c0_g2_i1.p1 TRINITY_DN3753_c0_g2~~TRINITY_DN3753_c0_g2_i1.p1  ORF type:complete len:977 (+),score=172.56 TRINITY_DN3753_c0_g2_i1:195-3125(+)
MVGDVQSPGAMQRRHGAPACAGYGHSAAALEGASHGTLAEDVLGVSGLLAQEHAETGLFTLSVDGAYHRGVSDGPEGCFELDRDDTMQLIGLLNSPEIDIAKRELAVLLKRLQRPAVEGVAHRLFAALARRGGFVADVGARRARSARAAGGGASTPGSPHSADGVRQPRGSGGALWRTANDDEALPSVFRRLTASALMQESASDTSTLRSFEVLSARENERGLSPPALTPLGEEEKAIERRSPRVSEEKAREIFDRLYQSGKEHRVRKRVYQELGMLVERAREAQDCTFEPRVPLAARRDQNQEGSVTERLYRESMERRRRREELALNAPSPPFRPQTTASRARRERAEGINPLSPRDTLAEGSDDENNGRDAGLDGLDGSQLPLGSPSRGEPTHVRLFREHEERKARHLLRQDLYAEWRKHPYRPDISSSQASGPLVLPRQHSMSGLPTHGSSIGMPEDEPEYEDVAVAQYEDIADAQYEDIAVVPEVLPPASPPVPMSPLMAGAQVEAPLEEEQCQDVVDCGMAADVAVGGGHDHGALSAMPAVGATSWHPHGLGVASVAADADGAPPLYGDSHDLEPDAAAEEAEDLNYANAELDDVDDSPAQADVVVETVEAAEKAELDSSNTARLLSAPAGPHVHLLGAAEANHARSPGAQPAAWPVVRSHHASDGAAAPVARSRSGPALGAQPLPQQHQVQSQQPPRMPGHRHGASQGPGSGIGTPRSPLVAPEPPPPAAPARASVPQQPQPHMGSPRPAQASQATRMFTPSSIVAPPVHRQVSSPPVADGSQASPPAGSMARSFSGWLPASPRGAGTPRTVAPPVAMGVARSQSGPVIGIQQPQPMSPGAPSPRIAVSPPPGPGHALAAFHSPRGAFSPGHPHMVVHSAVLPAGVHAAQPMAITVAALCTASSPHPPPPALAAPALALAPSHPSLAAAAGAAGFAPGPRLSAVPTATWAPSQDNFMNPIAQTPYMSHWR